MDDENEQIWNHSWRGIFKKIRYGFNCKKKIFQEINNKSEAILNFKNIEFMSRSFAQEYVFQKHNCNTKITEVNMSESIKQLLYIVSEDFEKTCLR